MIDNGALPDVVVVTQAFSQRLPSQRLIDRIKHYEGDATPFLEISQEQPFRVVAFRALLRDFPDRDPTSLWLHAYDVEVGFVDEDPTNGRSPIPVPLSAGTGDSGPTTTN
jgi:hypothetical protein